MANEAIRLFGANVNEVNISTQGQQVAQREMQRNDNNFFDFGKATREVAQVSTQIVNAQKTVEADKAKQDYLGMIMSEGYRDASSALKAEMFEGIYSGLGEQSDAYKDSFISYSSGEYTTQYDARGVEEDNALYNAAGAAKKAWDQETIEDLSDPEINEELTTTNIASGKGYADFVNEYVANNPRLDKVVVGRSLMSDAYSEMLLNVANAPATEEGLAKAMANVQDIKEPLMSPQFLTTKQKQGQAYVNSLEVQLGKVVKAKQGEIKQGYYAQRANAVKSGNRVPPADIEKAIDATSKDVFVATKEKLKYMKQYNEVTESDAYNAEYVPGDRPGILPDNKTLKEARQKEVTGALYNAFVSNDFEEFTRIADNESDMIADMGKGILTQFNKANTVEDITAINTRLNHINSTNKGPTILRQMFSDDEYVRMVAINNLSEFGSDKDLISIRNSVDRFQANTQAMKLPPSDNANIYEYANKLGSQGQKYLSIVESLKNISGQLALDEYKNVAEKLMDQVQPNSDLGGAKEDVSMSSRPEAVNDEKFLETMNTEVVKGNNNVIYMKDTKGNTSAIVRDDLGGTVTIQNLTPYLEENEEQELIDVKQASIVEEESITSDPIVGAKVATRAFIRDTIDNAGGFVMATPEVLGDLVSNMTSRLVEHMKDSIPDYQRELIGMDTKDEEASKELARTLIENEMEFIAEVNNIGDSASNNNTLDSVHQVGVDFAKQNAAMTMRKALEIKKEVGKQQPVRDVLKHLKRREGERLEVYNDSLGNPTAGVGHLLTASEKTKYPVGTKIPQKQVDAWLKQDTKKAIKAAEDQAKEFKIKSEDFTNALVSVNFQLGTGWTSKFPKAVKALKEGKWKKAVEEIKDSRWYKQTPVRVEDFEDAINRLG